MGRFQSAVDQGARDAEELLPRLEAVWRSLVEEWGVYAAARFSSLTAAGDATPWAVAPTWSELAPVTTQAVQAQGKTAVIRAAMIEAAMRPALVRFGLSFDVTNPVTDNVLQQLGRKIVGITETQRAITMQTIDDARKDGLSIPHTAAKIVERSSGQYAANRATVIARTELIGAQNGGSLAAARLVGVQSKQWLATGDNRTRPTHRDADGQQVATNDYFVVGVDLLQFPGDPSGSAAEIIMCRCTLAYSDDGLAPDGSLPGLGAETGLDPISQDGGGGADLATQLAGDLAQPKTTISHDPGDLDYSGGPAPKIGVVPDAPYDPILNPTAEEDPALAAALAKAAEKKAALSHGVNDPNVGPIKIGDKLVDGHGKELTVKSINSVTSDGNHLLSVTTDGGETYEENTVWLKAKGHQPLFTVPGKAAAKKAADGPVDWEAKYPIGTKLTDKADGAQPLTVTEYNDMGKVKLTDHTGNGFFVFPDTIPQLEESGWKVSAPAADVPKIGDVYTGPYGDKLTVTGFPGGDAVTVSTDNGIIETTKSDLASFEKTPAADHPPVGSYVEYKQGSKAGVPYKVLNYAGHPDSPVMILAQDGAEAGDVIVAQPAHVQPYYPNIDEIPHHTAYRYEMDEDAATAALYADPITGHDIVSYFRDGGAQTDYSISIRHGNFSLRRAVRSYQSHMAETINDILRNAQERGESALSGLRTNGGLAGRFTNQNLRDEPQLAHWREKLAGGLRGAQAMIDELEADMVSTDADAFLRDIDAAFANAPPTTQAMSVTRGTGNWMTEAELNGLVGEVFQDGGFMSTAWEGGFSGQLRWEITIPEGSRVLDVGSISKQIGENEILLPRGTKLFVSRVEKGGAGAYGTGGYTIYARVIHV